MIVPQWGHFAASAGTWPKQRMQVMVSRCGARLGLGRSSGRGSRFRTSSSFSLISPTLIQVAKMAIASNPQMMKLMMPITGGCHLTLLLITDICALDEMTLSLVALPSKKDLQIEIYAHIVNVWKLR